MLRRSRFPVIALLIAISLSAGSAWAFFEKTKRDVIPEAYFAADIRRGGLLFDQWFETVKGPEGTHPLYPAGGPVSGTATWRCVTCHGWGYRGSEGTERNVASLPGVYESRASRPAELFDALSDKGRQHDFSPYLGEKDLWSLVKFIREGMVDVSKAVDDKGRGVGDIKNGMLLYADHCAACHGADGGLNVTGERKDCTVGVGWISLDHPAQTLHKIRWGHPGSEMPSMVVDKKLSFHKAIDILTYSQSLRDECSLAERKAEAERSREAEKERIDHLAERLQAADDALKALIGGAPEVPAGASPAGGRITDQAAFRIAQQEFRVFRAAECRWRSSVSTTSADEAKGREADCLIEMTEQRTAELRRLLETAGSKR